MRFPNLTFIEIFHFNQRKQLCDLFYTWNDNLIIFHPQENWACACNFFYTELIFITPHVSFFVFFMFLWMSIISMDNTRSFISLIWNSFILNFVAVVHIFVLTVYGFTIETREANGERNLMYKFLVTSFLCFPLFFMQIFCCAWTISADWEWTLLVSQSLRTSAWWFSPRVQLLNGSQGICFAYFCELPKLLKLIILKLTQVTHKILTRTY